MKRSPRAGRPPGGANPLGMRSVRSLLAAIISMALLTAPHPAGATGGPSHSISSALEVSETAGLGRIELHKDIAAVLQRDEGIVALVDVSSPSRPKVLGRYDDGASQSLDGDLAFSSDGKWLFYARQTVQFSKDGLHVVDVSDPQHPSLASYQPAGGALRVTHYDDGTEEWVVVMDAIVGMVVYRFEPTSGVLVPVHVNPLPALKVGGPASAGVLIQNDPILKKPLLYASTGRTGVEVFDFTDPTSPVLLGAWNELGLAEIEVSVKAKRRLIYGAAEYWFDKTNPPVVVELDATRLGAIKKQSLLSAGCKTDDSQRVQGMTLVGDDLYAANSTVGLAHYSGPKLVGFAPVTRGAKNPGSGYQGSAYVFDVESDGSFLYATDASTGYLTIVKRSSGAASGHNPDESSWNDKSHLRSLGC